jgi:hypothetical protein
MQGGEKAKQNEELLMQPPVFEIPVSQDEGTISSDLTGFTGMTGSVVGRSRPPEFIVSGIKKPLSSKPSSPKPPVAYIQQGRKPPQSRASILTARMMMTTTTRNLTVIFQTSPPSQQACTPTIAGDPIGRPYPW